MWFNTECVRRTLPALVTSLGVKTDTSFEEALYAAVRAKVEEFPWGSYGLDYVAETLGDAEGWLDDLAAHIVDSVEITTTAWYQNK